VLRKCDRGPDRIESKAKQRDCQSKLLPSKQAIVFGIVHNTRLGQSSRQQAATGGGQRRSEMCLGARLGHIASTKWGKRRYLAMETLLNLLPEEAAA